MNELNDIIQVFGLGENDPRLDRLRLLGELYREWNSKINVISRKDIDNIYSHHVLHSLFIARYLQDRRPQVYAEWVSEGATVLDAGCGGGFPGIPLAIFFPRCRFVLCDSIRKKTVVASGVAGKAAPDNVQVVNCRFESLPDVYDYAVSRAVASLDVFWPMVEGRFRKSLFYLKGGDTAPETEAMLKACRNSRPEVLKGEISDWTDDVFFKDKYVLELRKPGK